MTGTICYKGRISSRYHLCYMMSNRSSTVPNTYTSPAITYNALNTKICWMSPLRYRMVYNMTCRQSQLLMHLDIQNENAHEPRASRLPKTEWSLEKMILPTLSKRVSSKQK